MRKVTAIAIVLGLALAAGCGDKDKDKEKADDTAQTDQTPPADEPPKDEPKVPDEAADTMINKMANCPNAVEGATTEIADAEGAVAMTVTAEGEEAVAEVRKRAAALKEVDDATSPQVEHTGKGTGGGGLGKCPVVMKDTSLAVEEVEGGVTITLTPADAANLEALKTEVTNRHAGMGEALKKAAGGGEGGHGSGTGGGGGGGDHDGH